MLAQPRPLSQVVLSAQQRDLHVGVEASVRGAEPGGVGPVLFLVPHVPPREQEVDVVAVGDGLDKVVVVLRVASHHQFAQFLLLREGPARREHREQTPRRDWRDVAGTFTSVASTNQHQAQDATSPTSRLFVFRGYHYGNGGDARVIGGNVLSVDWVGGPIDELRDVGQTPREQRRGQRSSQIILIDDL